MPKSTFIESIQDFHVWHQWVECRTILTPRVIMRSREVLWVEIATDTRERRLCPYEFHWTPGTRPRLTKTARSQDSLLGALWSYNGNSSETFTEKLTTRHFKLFRDFSTFRSVSVLQSKVRKYSWSCRKTEDRGWAQKDTVKLLSLCPTRSQEIRTLSWEKLRCIILIDCVSFFYFSVHLIWFTYLQNQYLHLNKMSPDGTNNGVKLLMYRKTNCNRFNFLQYL